MSADVSWCLTGCGRRCEEGESYCSPTCHLSDHQNPRTTQHPAPTHQRPPVTTTQSTLDIFLTEGEDSSSPPFTKSSPLRTGHTSNLPGVRISGHQESTAHTLLQSTYNPPTTTHTPFTTHTSFATHTLPLQSQHTSHLPSTSPTQIPSTSPPLATSLPTSTLHPDSEPYAITIRNRNHRQSLPELTLISSNSPYMAGFHSHST